MLEKIKVIDMSDASNDALRILEIVGSDLHEARKAKPIPLSVAFASWLIERNGEYCAYPKNFESIVEPLSLDASYIFNAVAISAGQSLRGGQSAEFEFSGVVAERGVFDYRVTIECLGHTPTEGEPKE